MGIVKDYSRRVADAGRIDNVQTVASTNTSVENYGLSIISSTSAGAFLLGVDPVAGLRKTVVVTGGPSTGALTLDGNGTTINGSTDLSLGTNDGVQLVGLSTAAWGIVSLSTA